MCMFVACVNGVLNGVYRVYHEYHEYRVYRVSCRVSCIVCRVMCRVSCVVVHLFRVLHNLKHQDLWGKH
jgi:hypothetical protein